MSWRNKMSISRHLLDNILTTWNIATIVHSYLWHTLTVHYERWLLLETNANSLIYYDLWETPTPYQYPWHYLFSRTTNLLVRAHCKLTFSGYNKGIQRINPFQTGLLWLSQFSFLLHIIHTRETNDTLKRSLYHPMSMFILPYVPIISIRPLR